MYRHSTDAALRAAAIAYAEALGREHAASYGGLAYGSVNGTRLWADALAYGRARLGIASHRHPETYGATAADEWQDAIVVAYDRAYQAAYAGR